jgi:hypothetical protein
MEEKQTELNPVESTEKPAQQSLVTAVVIFILLVVVGTAFFFLGKAQNTKQTKNSAINPPTVASSPKVVAWKTYSNAKYNYSIEYPGDWVAHEYPDLKDGAFFNTLNMASTSSTNITVSISVAQKMGNYTNLSLEEYAKVAGKEIQNYDSLVSIKKVIATSGAVGYETTWMVQPMAIMGQPPTASASESLPITYFEIPGNKTSLIRVMAEQKEHLAVYEKMITTFKINTSLTSQPTVDEASTLKYVIKKYIALKHKSDESALAISVSKVEGNYAKGTANDEGGGGMWFAAKEDGVWKLVWDGNGIIECSTFDLYPQFPTSLVPSCFDPAKQDTVQR